MPGKLSDKLSLPRDRKQARFAERVLRVVDSVHRDGPLPVIPLHISTDAKETGFYAFREDDGKAVEIVISRKGPHPELTLLHELGHFIDHQGIAGGGIFGSSTELLKPLRQLAASTGSFMALRNYVQFPGRRDEERHLGNAEVFARAYAQYIVTKSSDHHLISQLDSRRRGEYTSLGPMLQWGDDEFAPLLADIDRVFGILGWTK